jgi:hypothetical protein
VIDYFAFAITEKAPIGVCPRRNRMLTIRYVQMGIFENAATESFVDDMLHLIATDYPRQFAAMDEEDARSLVRRVITLGSENYVETRGGVAALVALTIQFGEEFRHSPDRKWALEMLAQPKLPASLKVDIMRERMTAITRGRVVVPFVAGQ